MTVRIHPVRGFWELPQVWRGTPVEDLLGYQNLSKPFRRHERAELLIGTCMDPRIALRIPEGFAYVLRTAAGNLAPVDWNVSYVVGAKGVRFVAVVGHTLCGAVGFAGKHPEYEEGLVQNAGWTPERARRHVAERAGVFAIDDAAAFAAREARRIEAEYPRIRAAALLYDVGDHTLAVVEP